MKKFIALIMLSVLLISLVSCGDSGDTNSVISAGDIKKRDITVVYADGFADKANELCQKISELNCTAVSKPFEKDMTFDGDVIVVGYVDHASINDAVNTIGINDYCLIDLADCFYIGGRADADVMDDALDMFYKRYVTGRQYLVTSGVSYDYTTAVTLDKSVINGTKLTEYTIVYAPSPGEAISYQTLAGDVASLLEQKTGVKFTVAADTADEAEHEIIIGSSAKRESSKKYRTTKFDNTDYLWDVTDGGIVFTGGSSNAIYSAVLDFISTLERSTNTALDGNKVVRKSTTIIKVACIGDSITQGDSTEHCYPTYLQEMLGYDYEVKNFGVSGYSTRKQDNYPYAKTSQYNSAIKYAADVVIYMLGTNDCQPTKSWDDDTKKTYKESANEIFQALTKANPNVEIYVVLPPSLFENDVWQGWQTWSEQVKEYAVPLNKELAEENGYEIIDAYTWSLTHSDVFKDGLHPSGETYRDFASCIYQGLKNSISEVR